MECTICLLGNSLVVTWRITTILSCFSFDPPTHWGRSMHIHTSRLFSRLLYTIKHSGGKTFLVHQQYTLRRETFCGLPLTAYFTVLIYKAGKFSVVKCLQLAKICENHESFLLEHFIIYGSRKYKLFKVN